MAPLLVFRFQRVVKQNFRLIGCFSFSSRISPNYPGVKAEVNGVEIHYEKIGSGKKKLLLLPGAIGTTRTDFNPQLEMLDPQKFTLVAVDPVGYGYSRPPDRSYPDDMYYRDAEMAALLMQVLKYPKYSVLGWSDGGITGLILAARHREAIEKLIVLGANAYITQEDADLMEQIRDLNKWSDKMKAPLIAMYGEKYFKELWNAYVNFYCSIYATKGGDICKGELSKIDCPTLVVHGDKDPVVSEEHPYFLQKHIKNSRLHIMKDGKHNLHLRYAAEFNKLLENFMNE